MGSLEVDFVDAQAHRSLVSKIVHIPSAPTGMIFTGLGQRVYDSLEGESLDVIRGLNGKFRVTAFPMAANTVTLCLAVNTLIIIKASDPGARNVPGLLHAQTEQLAERLCARLMDVASQAMFEWDVAKNKKKPAAGGISVTGVSLEGACATFAAQ